MSYMAYLCYPHDYNEEDDNDPVIKFEQPEQWRYGKILPIQFSVLHRWTDQDEELYK